MINASRNERPVELFTVHGVLRGVLPTTATRRTLDELNMASRTFITVEQPQSPGESWFAPSDALVVNKSAVLFLRELASPPVQPAGQFARFTRAPVSLRVGPCFVHGFMHVPPGGRPLKRLDQDPHAFIALTAVLVTGPDTEFTVPFLAVNRSHVSAAQQVGQSETASENAPATAGAGVGDGRLEGA